MALPANVSVCTITGTFVDTDGNPTEGTIVFVPTPVIIVDAGAIPPTTIMGTPIEVTLVAGSIPVGTTIPATDDPDLNPTGWTYRVIFNTAYYKPEEFFMNAPGGTTVDLTGVLPIPESPGVPTDIVDGNRGDITVSGNGLIWDINAGVVDTPELANEAITEAKLLANAPIDYALFQALTSEAGGFRWVSQAETWNNPINSGITVGSGSVLAKYAILGPLVVCYFRFIQGASGGVTGDVALTLPIDTLWASSVFGLGWAQQTARYPVHIGNLGLTTALVRPFKSDTALATVSSTPISSTGETWANGHTLACLFAYFKA